MLYFARGLQRRTLPNGFLGFGFNLDRKTAEFDPVLGQDNGVDRECVCLSIRACTQHGFPADIISDELSIDPIGVATRNESLVNAHDESKQVKCRGNCERIE